MSRVPLVVLVVGTVTLAVPGASTFAAEGRSALKLRVEISETAQVGAFGKFVLTGRGVSDSGSTALAPNEGKSGFRDGQHYISVRGTDVLTGKRGSLSFSWTGVHVNAAADRVVEYGTWKITAGSGTRMYKGWRGGGRWASFDEKQGSVSHYSVRWEGLVTR